MSTRGERWLWPALTAWTGVMFLLQARHLGTSWHFFDLGARLLVGPQAAHLYARHPELQFGPVATLFTLPLAALGPHVGRLVAVTGMAGTGPLLVRGLARHVRAPSRAIVVGGLPFLAAWTALGAGAGHVDDVLALGLGLVAVHVVSRRPLLAAALLGLAADAKPWAVGFVVALLVVPVRRLFPALVLWSIVVVVVWLPFVASDPMTVSSLTHFTIANSPSSALRFFEVDSARTPSWDRAAQLVLGVLVGGLAVRRHGPVAALVAVVAARLLLEPGTHLYYCGGLLAATLAYDLTISRRALPVLTVVGCLLYYAPQAVRTVHAFDQVASASRALACAGLLVLAVLLPARLPSGTLSRTPCAVPGPPAPPP